MSLQDPYSKMSKSDSNKNNLISLLDSSDLIIKKIKRAITDSKTEIRYTNSKGLENLIDIYSSFSGKNIDQIEKIYEGKQYSDFKKDLGEIIVECLRPFRYKYKEFINDKAFLDTVLKDNREKAIYLARRMMSKIYRKVGFVNKI